MWFKKKYLLPFHQITLLLLFAISTNAYSKNPISIKTKHNVILETINNLEDLNIFYCSDTVNKDSVKAFPDLVYEYHLAEISKQSPIDFDYNEYVRKYIDIYSLERREQVSQMLGLSKLYFPIFDEYLDKYQLPLELKYLAVVESALNPLAVSTSGAVGLWQFKINTARLFDLKVTSLIDERMDPEKSTDAACKYLKYLYKTFKNWHLAIAAYNTGPQPIRNAIERNNGETNFWKLYPYLPESAQNYLSAFMAAAYIMNNYKDHGIIPTMPTADFFQTDTVMVSKPIDLKLTSDFLGIDLAVIQFLNPEYKLNFIPENTDYSIIRLPSDKIDKFVKNEQKIIKQTNKTTALLNNEQEISKTNKITYTVKDGDSMHRIAINFNCTIKELQNWNPSIDTVLYKGQQLVIWTIEN